MAPAAPAGSARIAALSGPREVPSPKTSRVTPWRTSLWPRPSANSPDSLPIMLTKPGATAQPPASSSIRPRPAAPGAPPAGQRAAIVSPRTARSPGYGGAPLPS